MGALYPFQILGVLDRSVRFKLLGSISKESSLHFGATHATRIKTAYFQYMQLKHVSYPFLKIYNPSSSALKLGIKISRLN
jgi:hypothetical protein